MSLEILREALLNHGLKLGEGFDKGGKPYSWMVDSREVLLAGSYLPLAARLLWQRVKPYRPRMVGGMTLAANPLVIAMLYEARADGYGPLDAFLIRREPKGDGLRKLVEGPPIAPRTRVVLLDDIVNSGETQKTAMRALDDFDPEVVAVAALLDAEAAGARWLEGRGVPLEALFTMRELGIKLPQGLPTLPVRWAVEGLNRAAYMAPKSAVAVAGDRLLLGADRGFLLCLDRDGRELWRVAMGDGERGVHATPLVHAGRAYVGAYDGFFYALDVSTGRVEWRVRLGQWIGSSACLDAARGRLYVGVERGEANGALLALDAATGAVAWELPANHYVHATPLYDAGRDQVLVGANDGTLYAVDAAHGRERWRHVTGGEIKGGAALDAEGRAFVTSFDGALHALDAASGRPLWSRRLGTRAYWTPLLADDLVLAGGQSGRLLACERASGRVRWVATAGDRLLGGGALLPGNRVAFGANDGCLYLADAATGAMQAAYRSGAAIMTTPTYHEGALYVPSCDGRVYALSV